MNPDSASNQKINIQEEGISSIRTRPVFLRGGESNDNLP